MINLYADEKCCGHDYLALSTDGYESIIENLLSRIYEGNIGIGEIDYGYYNYISTVLSSALTKVLGTKVWNAGNYQNTLKAYFQENILAFSGAKSLTVLKTYNKLLLDENGDRVSWEKFKSRVADIDPILNVHHLQTERKDGISALQMADKWETLKQFDLLEYTTVGDNAVREKHRVLDKLVIKATDPLVDKIYPIKDHGCRCSMIPAATGAKPTDRNKIKILIDSIDVKPYFKHHVGKTKVVYDENQHPYYKNVNGKVSELQAERNYGMRSVQQIYTHNNLPELNELPTKEAALDWWTKLSGDVRGNFEIQAQNGISILFDNNFRKHVLEDNKDNRWAYFHNAVETLKTPDEVWAYRTKGVLEHRYIKYYADSPVVVGINDTRAFSVFKTKTGDKINVEGLRKSRMGVLIYKNENR